MEESTSTFSRFASRGKRMLTFFEYPGIKLPASWQAGSPHILCRKFSRIWDSFHVASFHYLQIEIQASSQPPKKRDTKNLGEVNFIQPCILVESPIKFIHDSQFYSRLLPFPKSPTIPWRMLRIFVCCFKWRFSHLKSVLCFCAQYGLIQG